MPARAGGAAEPGDEERAFELEEANRGRWLVGLPQGEGVVWTFRRGFPEVLEAPIDVFLERYVRFAAVPGVRSLAMFDVSNAALRDLVGREWNPDWVELDLQEHPMAGVIEYGYESTPGLLAVANSPRVGQLRTLRFTLFDFTPPAIRAFSSSPYLGGLQLLLVWSNQDDWDAPRFAPLRERFGNRFRVYR